MASTSYVNRFPIKKFSITSIPIPLLIHGLVGFFFLYLIFDCVRRIFNFLSQAQIFTKSQVCPLDSQGEKEKNSQNLLSLAREEVEMVMGNLGIFCHPQSVNIEERLDESGISDLFGDESETKQEDLREAFDIFDENKDGFIDERELQRVLCALGLRQVANLDSCKKMILAFDENGDGKIDFQEFVKLI